MPEDVDEWRTLLETVESVDVSAEYRPADPWGAIRYDTPSQVVIDDPGVVSQIARELAASLQPTGMAMALDWPHTFRLHLSGNRHLRCCVAEGALLVPGLSDSRARPALKALVKPWIERAEREAAIASGIATSGEELLELATDARELTLYGLQDDEFALLERFSDLESLNLQFCRDTLHDEGLAHLSRLPSLRELNLQYNRGLRGETFALLEQVESVNLYGAETLTADGFASIARMPRLRSLELNASGAVDGIAVRALARSESLRDLSLRYLQKPGADDLLALSEMSQLERLDLERTPAVDGDVVAALSRMPRLRELSLEDCGLSDADVRALESAASIEHLRLSHNELGPAALEVLATLPRLQHLVLRRAGKFGDAGLRALARQVRLRVLIIAGSGASDDGFAALGALELLEELDLSFSAAGDRTLEALSKLPELRRLEISGCKAVTDTGLLHLADCVGLRTIEFTHCDQVTAAAVQTLRESLPSCSLRAPE